MLKIVLTFISAIVISIIAGILVIPTLKKLKAGQPILSYVKEHESKSGTPTMGGLFLVMSFIIAFYLFGGGGGIAKVSTIITISFMFVGFLDDFIKIKSHNNEGLKPYQKMIFLTVISIIAGIFAYKNNLTIFYIPFTKIYIDLGVFTIPIIAIVFLAMTNSVNLTDGLDGLAGSVSLSYLLGFISLIIFQNLEFNGEYFLNNEYYQLVRLSFSGIGAILGFLVFNTFKATVFMGDTGSLALGGLLSSVAVFSGNTFFILIIGIMFAVSSISVIIQVAVFKKSKKRVFLMAPLHHHFQKCGQSESKICYVYSLITIICSCFAVIPYLV